MVGENRVELILAIGYANYGAILVEIMMRNNPVKLKILKILVQTTNSLPAKLVPHPQHQRVFGLIRYGSK